MTPTTGAMTRTEPWPGASGLPPVAGARLPQLRSSSMAWTVPMTSRRSPGSSRTSAAGSLPGLWTI
jgi:hypothetical protein